MLGHQPLPLEATEMLYVLPITQTWRPQSGTLWLKCNSGKFLSGKPRGSTTFGSHHLCALLSHAELALRRSQLILSEKAPYPPACRESLPALPFSKPGLTITEKTKAGVMSCVTKRSKFRIFDTSEDDQSLCCNPALT